MAGHRLFLEEVFRADEHDHRPEQGRWVLTRTRTVKKLKE